MQHFWANLVQWMAFSLFQTWMLQAAAGRKIRKIQLKLENWLNQVPAAYKILVRIQFFAHFGTPLIKYTWKPLSNAAKTFWGIYLLHKSRASRKPLRPWKPLKMILMTAFPMCLKMSLWLLTTQIFLNVWESDVLLTFLVYLKNLNRINKNKLPVISCNHVDHWLQTFLM